VQKIYSYYVPLKEYINVSILRKKKFIPVVARFSAPVQTGSGAHPASCTMGTGSFPEIKRGQGLTLTTHPLLVPRSRKSTAIPVLPL
jgi:hypothetical protein